MRIAASLAVVVTLASPVLLLAVHRTDGSADVKESKLYVMCYNIADLPVWRKGGLKTDPEFGPELLMKYLQLTVDPKSWNAGAEIHPSAKNASLVISQTQANHEKISAAISSFRLNNPREVEERVRAN